MLDLKKLLGGGNGKKRKAAAAVVQPSKGPVWENMNFAATEAYNLLRTNLTLSFADEEGARFIGVTSTSHAEGKSLTSINLAVSLAKANHKTLLLEGDWRLPSLGKTLRMSTRPGIAEYLTGLAGSLPEVTHAVPQCENFDVIFCGRTPPNPSELLGSKRMESVLQQLGGRYEYIIVDLPPIGEVPDALVLAKKLHGMIVVVRGDYTSAPGLADTMRQLQYTGARVLGFVFNDAKTTGHGYGKKYYNKYGNYGYAGASNGAGAKKR